MRYSYVFKVALKCVAITVALLLPLSSKAQVGFIQDVALTQLCMSQNWETKKMQAWMKPMPKSIRVRLFSSIRFSSTAKQCLMKHKPVSVALCDRVIAQYLDFAGKHQIGRGTPFQKITRREHDKIDQALNKTTCNLGDTSDDETDWVPLDLRPSASTLALLERAEQGDVPAQLASYVLYTEAADVPVNVARATYWLRRAAIGGNVDAQYAIGRRYKIGTDGTDVEQAIRFLAMAADQGHRDAMQELGGIYAESIDQAMYGSPEPHKDMTKALSWYTKAADLGDPYAAAALAYIYASGNHVSVDAEKAFFWYEKSAQLGYAEAMGDLSELYQKGVGTQADGKLAQQWRRKADQLGVNGGGKYLINYFPWGEVPENAAEAAGIQLKHATAGDVDAQIAIASRYGTGEGVEKDEQVAITWWTRAANADDPIAQRMLGKYLMDNAETPNPDQDAAAIEWLRKAAAKGDLAAQATLAFWHIKKRVEHGVTGKSHHREAIRLIRDAGHRGYKPGDSEGRAQSWSELLTEE